MRQPCLSGAGDEHQVERGYNLDQAAKRSKENLGSTLVRLNSSYFTDFEPKFLIPRDPFIAKRVRALTIHLTSPDSSENGLILAPSTQHNLKYTKHVRN